MRGWFVLLAVLGVVVGACTSEPAASTDYQELEQRLAAVEESVDQIASQTAVVSEPPASSWAGSHSVSVTVSGLDHLLVGELAGVVYTEPGGQPIGGFTARVNSGNQPSTQQVRVTDPERTGWLPLAQESLLVAPGDYVLVLWGDLGLGGYTSWIPLNTDSQGLVGCVHRFTVDNQPETRVVFDANPFSPRSFGVCGMEWDSWDATRSQSWTDPKGEPAQLWIEPATVPAETGIVTVAVHGEGFTGTSGIWVMPCPAVGAEVDPSNWPKRQPGVDRCGDLSVPNYVVNVSTAEFTIELDVPITETAITEGGIVITTGDIWQPVWANVLLEVSPASTAP